MQKKYKKKKVYHITGRKVLTMMDSAVKVQWIPLDRIFPKYEYSMLQVWNYCKIFAPDTRTYLVTSPVTDANDEKKIKK